MQGDKRVKVRARRLFFSDPDTVAREMARLGVDPVGIEIMSGKAEHYLIYLENISSKAANIIKQEALARGADLAVPWKVANFAPGSTEAILMGTWAELTSLASKLRRQEHFRLPEVAGQIEGILANDRQVAGFGRVGDFGRKTILLRAEARGENLDALVTPVIGENLGRDIHVPTVRDALGVNKALQWGSGLIRLKPDLGPEALERLLRELVGADARLILGPGPMPPDFGAEERILAVFRGLRAAIDVAVSSGLVPERLILECPFPDPALANRLSELRSLGRPLLVDLASGPEGWPQAEWPEAAYLGLVSVLAVRGADMIRLRGSRDLADAALAALRVVDAVAKVNPD